MPRLNSYPNVGMPSKDDEVIIDGAAGTRNVTLLSLAMALGGMISPTMRRNIYRGATLGDTFTDNQKTAIAKGTFDNMFIGDYWGIDGVIYRIVDFDYWLKTGDTNCETHHVVLMPDHTMNDQPMNTENTTWGGYTNSFMYKFGLNLTKDKINAAFGSSYVLNHREYLTNAVTNGKPSGGAWFDSTVELPNEIMMYGSYIYTPSSDGQTIPLLYTIDKMQLAAFRMNPTLINSNRQSFWFRDVVSASHFAYVNGNGNAAYGTASDALGVRPVFGIHG